MASQAEWTALLDRGVTAVLLVLTFGWAGSPGEWTPWALATLCYHRAFAPADAVRDGPEAFRAHMLMDDAVLVEPDIGRRPALSASVYDAGARAILGPAAINVSKLAEEGEMRTCQTAWGLTFDTEQQTVRLPEQRILKGAHLLASSVYDPGNQRVTLLDLQRLHGTAQSWTPVLPTLTNELTVLNGFLGPPADNGLAQPRGGPAERAAAWRGLWELVELLRLLVARPEVWEARLWQGLAGMLNFEERLAVPGEADRVVFVSADATLELHGAVDWTGGVAIQRTVVEDGRWLALAVDLEAAGDPDLIINVAELLALLVLASHRAKQWSRRLVLYAGDNMVVRYWLENRKAGNAYAQYLLRALAFLEARAQFQLLGFYLRTYHNVTADLITRTTRAAFRQEMSRMGLRVEEVGEAWQRLLEESRQGQQLAVLGLDPEDDRVALQLRERRARRHLPRGPSQAPRAVLWDVGSETGPVGRCWQGLGGEARHVGAAPLGAALPPPPAAPALAGAVVVLTAGRCGLGAVQQWARACRQQGAELMLVVGAGHGRQHLPLRSGGWEWAFDAVLETELGDPHCRRLCWDAWRPAGRALVSLEEMGCRQPVAPPAGPLLLRPAEAPLQARAALVRHEPALRARCGPLYPHAVAHAFDVTIEGKPLGGDSGPQRHMVYSPAGPLPKLGPWGPDGPAILFHEPKAGGSCLRVLRGAEASRLWCAPGGTEGAPAAYREEPCRRAAGAAALWAALNAEALEQRCGVCADRDEERHEKLILDWLRAWRGGAYQRPAAPPGGLGPEPRGGPASVVAARGAPSRARGDRATPPACPVQGPSRQPLKAARAAPPPSTAQLRAAGRDTRVGGASHPGSGSPPPDAERRRLGGQRLEDGRAGAWEDAEPHAEATVGLQQVVLADTGTFVAALLAETLRGLLRTPGAEEQRRAGARPARAKQGLSAARVAAASLCTPAGGPRGFVPLEDPLDIEHEVREYTCDKLTGRLAASTAGNYQREWERWCWACRCRGLPPLLCGRTVEEKVRDEDRVLAYLGFLGWLGKSGSAVKGALIAVQGGHRRAAVGDPIKDMERVRLLCDRLVQETTLRPRRLGVTPPMLAWLRRHLDPRYRPRRSAPPEGGDRAMLWAALMMAWFFLLRAREYSNAGKVDLEQIMRGRDVSLKAAGVECRPGEADQVDLQFRKSKADQEAFGATRTHFANYVPRDGVRLCPVEALEILRSWHPERFHPGEEAAAPLFRWNSGAVLHRTQVQTQLQLAAGACNLPAGRFMTHSLRIGGASALYHATGEIETVKRYGRWSSGAFHRYLWDSSEQSQGMAEKMATCEATLHYT